MSEQRPDRPTKKPLRPAPQGPGPMRFGRGLFGWMLFIALAVMLFMFLRQQSVQTQNIDIGEFESRLAVDKVAKVIIQGDVITGEFSAPQAIGKDKVAAF